jgi:hypothetical protein
MRAEAFTAKVFKMVIPTCRMTEIIVTGSNDVSSMKVSLKPVVTALMTAEKSFIKPIVTLRYCKKCNDLLPIHLFKPDNKRKYTCIPHIRAERRHNILGTPIRRAFNGLRCRARDDSIKFGHNQLKITRKHVISMLTTEHISNFSAYSLIPLRPDVPLADDNAVIVQSDLRRFVVNKWRENKDSDQYEQNLRSLIGPPN